MHVYVRISAFFVFYYFLNVCSVRVSAPLPRTCARRKRIENVRPHKCHRICDYVLSVFKRVFMCFNVNMMSINLSLNRILARVKSDDVICLCPVAFVSCTQIKCMCRHMYASVFVFELASDSLSAKEN